VVVLNTFGWDGSLFYVAVCLLVLGGLSFPIGLKCWVLRRIPALDRIS
jgi:hypothetical protein